MGELLRLTTWTLESLLLGVNRMTFHPQPCIPRHSLRNSTGLWKWNPTLISSFIEEIYGCTLKFYNTISQSSFHQKHTSAMAIVESRYVQCQESGLACCAQLLRTQPIIGTYARSRKMT